MAIWLAIKRLLGVALELFAAFVRWFFRTWIPLWLAALVCLVLTWGFFDQMGAKAAAQREARKVQEDLELAETDLAICRENTAKLETAAKETKASMERVEAEGKRKLGEAEKALKVALRGRKTAERIALELAAPVDGADACTRMLNVDQKVLRSLR